MPWCVRCPSRRSGPSMKTRASRGTRRDAHGSTRRRLERPTASPTSPASGGELIGIPYRPSLPGSLAINRQDEVAAAPRRLSRRAGQQVRPDPNSPPVAAFWDIGTNIKDGLPLTPWAAELKKQRMATNSVNNPDANCLPLGIHPLHTHPDPRQIIQTPKLVVIAWESNYGLRFIHTDGRKLPPLGEPSTVVVRLLRRALGRRHPRRGNEQRQGRRDGDLRRVVGRERQSSQQSR